MIDIGKRLLALFSKLSLFEVWIDQINLRSQVQFIAWITPMLRYFALKLENFLSQVPSNLDAFDLNLYPDQE